MNDEELLRHAEMDLQESFDQDNDFSYKKLYLARSRTASLLVIARNSDPLRRRLSEPSSIPEHADPNLESRMP